MGFVPDHKLSELSKMAGFDTVDELAEYACTTRQNLAGTKLSQNRVFLESLLWALSL